MTSEGLVFDTRINPGARGDSRGLSFGRRLSGSLENMFRL
jgi:hypothetical protein